MPTKVQITALTVRHGKTNTTVLRIRNVLDRIIALGAAGTVLSSQQQAQPYLWIEDGALTSAALLARCTALIGSCDDTLGNFVA